MKGTLKHRKGTPKSLPFFQNMNRMEVGREGGTIYESGCDFTYYCLRGDWRAFHRCFNNQPAGADYLEVLQKNQVQKSMD